MNSISSHGVLIFPITERDDVLNITIPNNAGESMMDRKLIPLITTGFDELGPRTYFEGAG